MYENTKYSLRGLPSDVATRQDAEVGDKVEGAWRSPPAAFGDRWGSGGESSAKPPEVEKHDININFALRITVVNAYRPFYSSYIIAFVIGFSRSSHINDFESLYRTRATTSPLCVHTSHGICTNLGIESRPVGGGPGAPFASPVATVMHVVK